MPNGFNGILVCKKFMKHLCVLTAKICNFFVMVNDFVPLGTSQSSALILQILSSQSNTIFKVR